MALTPTAGHPRPGLRSLPVRLTRRLTAVTTSAALALAGLTTLAPAGGVGPVASAEAASPSVGITTLLSGLSIPWDVLPLPEGQLTAERGGKVAFRSTSGRVSTVRVISSGFWAAGETGRMSLVADPGYSASSKRLFSCEGYRVGGVTGVRVVQWRLSVSAPVTLTYERTVISRLPITSGRHGGCRLAFTGGALLVGTGDAAVGTNPQSLSSLGGKVLRLDARTGLPKSDNPFYSRGGNARYVYSFGHRNVQGLAIRPGSNQIWTAEHGSDRDDEVNRIRRGGNFGWNPVPGYNESVPMTDTSLTTAGAPVYAAAWRSGSPTVATSGIAFLRGSGWGSWEGAIAVAELKGQGIRLLRVDSAGRVTDQEQLAALDGSYGRIRSVVSRPNELYVTTANGSGDRVLLLRPRG